MDFMSFPLREIYVLVEKNIAINAVDFFMYLQYFDIPKSSVKIFIPTLRQIYFSKSKKIPLDKQKHENLLIAINRGAGLSYTDANIRNFSSIEILDEITEFDYIEVAVKDLINIFRLSKEDIKIVIEILNMEFSFTYTTAEFYDPVTLSYYRPFEEKLIPSSQAMF